MTEQPGGYRAPSNPASVSGPGALSQRTDVQAPMPMTGGPYGEATEMAEIQAGAPMAADPPRPSPMGLMDPADGDAGPLTAGVPVGDGPGPEVLRQSRQRVEEMNSVSKYLPMMERMAGRLDAPQSFRALVQYIKANQ